LNAISAWYLSAADVEHATHIIDIFCYFIMRQGALDLSKEMDSSLLMMICFHQKTGVSVLTSMLKFQIICNMPIKIIIMVSLFYLLF